MKRYSHKMRFKRRSGSTIVEFALVVPILLAILIGIMEFGWLVKNTLTIANSTREGARAAAVGRSTTDIRNRVIEMARPLPVVSPNGSILMQYSTDNGVTYLPWPADLITGKNGVLSGQLIKITVTSKHRSLTGFFPFLSNRNLQSNVVMRREA